MLTPYVLPADVVKPLMALAEHSDFLLFGEIHGTQEVPRVVLGLMGSLGDLGYSALALEVPYHDRPGLIAYGKGTDENPPGFFARPTPDGRGNRETLELTRLALVNGWQVLCFDQGMDQAGLEWRDRETWMARNFSKQHRASCPAAKVIAITGNLHSRISNTPGDSREFWPSFGARIQDAYPDKYVSSVAVVFHDGSFYNMGVRSVRPQPSPVQGVPELRESDWRGHTLELHLPKATPATFLKAPGIGGPVDPNRC